MRLDNKNRALIKKIADAHGLTMNQVIEIIKAPSKFIREVTDTISIESGMTEEEFKEATYNFNLPLIGKLHASWSNYRKYYKHGQNKPKGHAPEKGQGSTK